jgi:phosphotransferase system enzyme I (PtsP)
MLSALRHVVQKVNAAPNLEQAMAALVQCVKAEMGTEVCSVYLLNAEKTHYVLMATEGLKPESVGSVSLALKEGLVGLIAERAEPLNLQEAHKHPNFRYFPEIGEELFKSFMGSPIIHHGNVLGVLVVQQREARRFEEPEEAFLVTLSAQLAGVIAHAEATGALQLIAGTRRNNGKGKSTSFQGISGAQGVALGIAKVLTPVGDLAGIPMLECENTEREMTRFHHALVKVRGEIQRLGQTLENRLNKEEYALFDVYLRMLADNAIGGEVVNRIVSKKLQARSALSQVVMEHVRTFEAMDDAYLRERATDVKDLGLRVLAALDATDKEKRNYPDQTILIGEEITASMLGEVPEHKLAGIISVCGSRTSHMAIVARAMGIPTVLGAIGFPFQQLDKQEVIVDGYTGKIHTHPSPALKKQYEHIVQEEKILSSYFDTLKTLPCETPDKHRTTLWANTGLMNDVVRALERGAEGVGLYRSEITFLLRDRFPSEEEQRAIYREQLETFAPRPVTMRTLDVGGDKPLPYFPIKEENPFLGWRGIRICLDHPEIFLVQVRGMLKASEGLDNLRILLPMISCVSELESALGYIHRAHRELVEEGHDICLPEIGVMVEVPAAIYQIREFARRVDFLSVGSNDLTQYLLAVDRNNPRVAELFDSFHPAVLRALNWVVGQCHRENKQISICGEMAGDPSSAVLLMAMGYDMLSMNANNIPRVKSVLRQVSLVEAKQLLSEVLAMDYAKSITDHVRSTLEAKGISKGLLHN